MKYGDFEECDLCRSKPGTPTLCRGCLHNRALIDFLKSRLEITTARQIEVAKLGPNDVVLISSDQRVSADAGRNIIEHMKQQLKTDVPVLLLSGGLKLSIINKEQAEEISNASNP